MDAEMEQQRADADVDRAAFARRIEAARAAPSSTTVADAAGAVDRAADAIAAIFVDVEPTGTWEGAGRRQPFPAFVFGQWTTHLEGALRGLRSVAAAPPPPPRAPTPCSCGGVHHRGLP
jgi:hypothetical protein